VPSDAIVLAPAFNIDFSGLISNLSGISCICFFALLFIGLPILSAIQGQRRKLQYIPPRIGIEGHGIKRGLTAVEAGILMDEPLDKVMTMILFGVIKKGAAEVTTRDPLELSFAQTQPANLNQYEIDFLKAFGQKDLSLRRRALQDMTVALVKSVSEKMKGFSRKETQDYYKNIMEQAWAQVEAAKTPEIKGQAIDQNLEWTMLDHDYDNRSQRVFTGPIFLPIWWGGYDPMYRSAPHDDGSRTCISSNWWRSFFIARLNICGFSGRRRADFFLEGDRQPELVHQRRQQRDQSPASALDHKLSRRRWRSLRLCLRVCRLRLCLCRWRKIINTPKDYRYETYEYVQA
jgi:hypothetical protein